METPESAFEFKYSIEAHFKEGGAPACAEEGALSRRDLANEQLGQMIDVLQIGASVQRENRRLVS
ncbi:MAG TPA: hypothetical protein VJW94_05525 [Candidatus Acidoferrum sp.]|nr:hypothetical protein [Candidatus Acidoferrum sp.]